MTDTPARASQASLCMDDAAPIDTSSIPFHFISAGLKRSDTHVRSEGITGTRSQRDDRVRLAQTAVGGPLVFEPSPTEIDWLIEKILGGSTSAGVTDVADTLPEFLVAIDKITKVYTYAGCRVGRCTIAGNQGQPIRWTLEIEAETESEAAAGSFPALTLPTDNMFVFSDLTLTLLSTSRKFKSFSLTIDNALAADRYNNSLTRSEIPAMDRIVSLTVAAPFTSDNSDLYAAAIAGAAGSLAISDGSTTYTFDFGNVKIPAQGAEVEARGSEIQLPLQLMIYEDASSGDSQIKCTKS